MIKYDIRIVKSTTYLNFVRLGHAKTHWSRINKDNNTDKAMATMDKFYGSIFPSKWEYMKKALLGSKKYIALVNNFSDTEETIEKLKGKGAQDIREFFDSVKTVIEKPKLMNEDLSIKMERFKESVKESDMGDIYPSTESQPEVLDTGLSSIGNVSKREDNEPIFKEEASLLKGLTTAEIEESRIIEPEMGLRAGSLLSFIPATRIKGREDWLPESHHYSYYNSAQDFEVYVEEDGELNYPEHLKVFSYRKGGKETFPEPRKGVTGVFNYFPMDGASVLPVLALNLQPGDRMIDLCAAPGGKSLVALQTLLPEIVVANDSSRTRLHRLQRIMRDYLYDFDTSNKWKERVMITNTDALIIKDEDGFDKVLVDVPCTTDRHCLKENDNNIFTPRRVKERLRLPELQSELLCAGLSLCRVGGTVVYSTCTLSPVQNDGVVHMALKKAWENLSIKAKVMRLDNTFRHITSLFELGEGQTGAKYGQLVVPSTKSNFGPIYFAKIVRTQ